MKNKCGDRTRSDEKKEPDSKRKAKPHHESPGVEQ